MCKYCEGPTKYLKVEPTSYLLQKQNYDKLNCFILSRKSAELMIGTYEGYSFIDINYCPMCGRKLGD